MRTAVFGRARLATLIAAAVVTLTIAMLTPQRMKPRLAPATRAISGEHALAFEMNRGQTDAQVKFLARGTRHTLFLTATEAVLVWQQRAERAMRGVLRMQLVGANSHPDIVGQHRLPGSSNYFIGSDPRKWQMNVPRYARVEYRDVYPGVNLVYYGSQGLLEHDFVIAPGADPGAIKLDFVGAARAEIDRHGDLALGNPAGEIRLRSPFIYQEVDGSRRPVGGHYALSRPTLERADHIRVGFQVAAYDVTKPLVIDPTWSVSYSTYLGGAAVDGGMAIAVDTMQRAYVTGITASGDFPVQSPWQASKRGGNIEAFVTALNTRTGELIYSTYLGGSGDEYGNAIALDGAGNAYVTGWTSSDDFPIRPLPLAGPRPESEIGSLQSKFGGEYDAYVIKLDSAGSVVYSTYLGGEHNDRANDIAVNSQGEAFVTGFTESHRDFPMRNAMQTRFGGQTDAFVTKLSARGARLIYSTYLGGCDDDVGRGIAMDSSGNVYVAGSTTSSDFPMRSPFQAALGGSGDAFLSKFDSDGSLLASTYYGGKGGDGADSVAVSGPYAYLTGGTCSDDFPLTAPLQKTKNGACDAFVAKLRVDRMSSPEYSTYLGGRDDEDGYDLVVDSSEDVFITGRTTSSDFPVNNALYPFRGGESGADGFVTVLDKSFNILLSTWLGGNGNDEGGRGIAWDGLSVYVTGNTDSSDFPLTDKALPITLAGGQSPHAFVTKFTIDLSGGIARVR